MTINLTELRDEPLGKHPSQAAVSLCAFCDGCYLDAQQDVVAADYESCFTFDVDGLSDEALEAPHAVLDRAAIYCAYGTGWCKLSDEATTVADTHQQPHVVAAMRNPI